MTEHILLPHVKLKEVQLVQAHQEWLFRWLSGIENEIENGDVSASLCLQGILSELAIYGAPKTERDKPVSSPLVGLYAKTIAEFCPDEMKENVILWLKAYGVHLKREPLDIQAFRIRDEDISFGTDLSPLEIIAVSFLIANVN